MGKIIFLSGAAVLVLLMVAGLLGSIVSSLKDWARDHSRLKGK